MHRNPLCPSCSHSFTITDSSHVHNTKQPLLLQCGHSCCENCLLKATRSNKEIVKCTVCKAVTDLSSAGKGVKSLSPDVFVNGILYLNRKHLLEIELQRMSPAGSASQKPKPDLINGGYMKGRICSECVKNFASCRCEKCDSIVCGTCFDKIHAWFKSLRHHQAIPLEIEEEEKAEEKGLHISPVGLCEEHNRSIEFFCDDCDNVMICSRCCITGDHKGHSVSSIEENNSHLCDSVESAIQTVNQVLRRLKSSEKKLFSYEPDYSNDCNKLVDDVKVYFRWIHGLLQIREMDTIRDVNDTFADGAAVIQRMKSQLHDTNRDVSNLLKDARKLQNGVATGEGLLNAIHVLDKLDEASKMPCVLATKDKPTQLNLHMKWPENFGDSILNLGSISGDVESLVSLEPLSEGAPDLLDIISESESVVSSTTVDDSDVIIEEEIEETLSGTFSNASRSVSRQSSIEPPTNKLRSARVTRKNKPLQEVNVTHIKDPSCFMIQYCSDSRDLKALQKNMHRWCTDADREKHGLDNPSPGDLVLCKYTIDSTWYRARLKKVFFEETDSENPEKKALKAVEVNYFDFGNSEMTTPDRVLKMQSKFMKHVEFAHECCLYDIVHLEGESCWSKDATQTLYQMTNNKTMLLSVIQEVNNVLHVDLCCPPTADIRDDRPASVKDALVFMELANYFSASHPSATPQGYQPNRQFLCPEPKHSGESFEAVISHNNSPDSFYVQELGVDAHYMSAMLTEMQDLYGADTTGIWNILCPQIGMVCAAPLQAKDIWARAKILALPGNRQVKVQFVDFGNVETVPSVQLKKLLDKFLFLPTFALHCQLADVIPVQESGWCEKTSEWCAANLKDTKCSANVIKVSTEKVHLQLLAVIDDLQYCLNWKLVREKLAVSTGKSSRLPNNTDTSALENNPFLLRKNVVQAAADTTTGEKPDVTRVQLAPTKILKRASHRGSGDSNSLPVSSSSSVNSLVSAETGDEKNHRLRFKASDSDSTAPNERDAYNNILSDSKDSVSSSQKESTEEERNIHKRKTSKKKKISTQAKTPDIRSPAGLEVVVTCCESPSKLYVQRATAYTDGLQDLQKEICEEYSTKLTTVILWKTGQYCAAKRHDGNWYRGRIISVIDRTCSQVLMEDFGFMEIIEANCLHNLSDKFIKNYVSFAQLCHLADLIPTGDISKWSRTAIEFIHGELGKKKSYLVKKGDKDENGSQPIDLLIETHVQESALEPASRDYYSLSDKLKEKGLAMPMRRRVKKPEQVENPVLAALALTNSSPAVTDGEATCHSPTSPPVQPHIMLKPPCLFYKPCAVPSQSCLSVIPTYVDYGCIVYIHVVGEGNETDEYLTAITDSMQKYFNEPSIYSEPEQRVVGQACAAYYNIDKHWYRGKVIDIPEAGDKLRVQYVDYGNSVWLPLDHVRTDVERFIEVPPQAIECVLHQTQPSSEQLGVWSTSVLESIHELIVNQNCKMVVQDVLENGHLSVTLTLPGGIDLTALLCNQGLAVKVIGYKELEDLSLRILSVLENKSQFQFCELPDLGTMFSVLITHVDLPNVVYFQRSQSNMEQESAYVKNVIKELGQLEKLSADIHTYSSTALQLEKPRQGAPCCAQYSLDNRWYRALIVTLQEDLQQVFVYFVDYGNSEFVPFDRLRVMPAQFMILPTQAIRCLISNIAPPNDRSWDIDAKEAITAELYSKYLMAALTSSSPNTAGVFFDPEDSDEDEPDYAYEILAVQNVIRLTDECKEKEENKPDVVMNWFDQSPDKRTWAEIIEAEENMETKEGSDEDSSHSLQTFSESCSGNKKRKSVDSSSQSGSDKEDSKSMKTSSQSGSDKEDSKSMKTSSQSGSDEDRKSMKTSSQSGSDKDGRKSMKTSSQSGSDKDDRKSMNISSLSGSDKDRKSVETSSQSGSDLEAIQSYSQSGSDKEARKTVQTSSQSRSEFDGREKDSEKGAEGCGSYRNSSPLPDVDSEAEKFEEKKSSEPDVIIDSVHVEDIDWVTTEESDDN